MDSFSSNTSTAYENVTKLLSDCIHITAVKEIVTTVDALNNISVQSEFSGKFIFSSS